MNSHKPIRIVVIEDHQVLSGAIRSPFNKIDDLEVTGIAASIADGIAMVSKLQPDVVVSDFRLGDGDIPDHLDDLAAAAPGGASSCSRDGPTRTA